MKFNDALDLLKMGVKVTRTSWGDPTEYIWLDKSQTFRKKKGDIDFPVCFFSHEILAEDWEATR